MPRIPRADDVRFKAVQGKTYQLANGAIVQREADPLLMQEKVSVTVPSTNGPACLSKFVPCQLIADNPEYELRLVENIYLELQRDIFQKSAVPKVMIREEGGNNMSHYERYGYFDGLASDWNNDITGTSTCCPQQYISTPSSSQMFDLLSNSLIDRKIVINVKLKLGKHTLTVCKSVEIGAADNVEITQEDIDQAKVNYIKSLNITILTKKAERKAEDLLKMFISDIDFRNYKEKGYFTVRSGNRLFKIHKDHHKWVDTWERKTNGIFVPKNRLCTHTVTRELPLADEALQKLMLIKSNRIEQYANIHGIDNNEMKEIHERDLVLV